MNKLKDDSVGIDPDGMVPLDRVPARELEPQRIAVATGGMQKLVDAGRADEIEQPLTKCAHD
ncbi:MAG TPA: hypothetical protein VFQ53_04685 [Kofleriaceae bacterium]|nr:hypothetical protein [Kofleriaceae bacterium]